MPDRQGVQPQFNTLRGLGVPHLIRSPTVESVQSGFSQPLGADCRWTVLEGHPPAPIQPAIGSDVPRVRVAPRGTHLPNESCCEVSKTTIPEGRSHVQVCSYCCPDRWLYSSGFR